MKQSISLELGEFALNALAEGAHHETEGAGVVPTRIVRAIRYYLCDSNSGRIEWLYPDHLRENASATQANVEFDVDATAWADFEREAERQGVSVRRLVEHAALYFAADRDAGRVTQRILDDLAEED